MSAPIRIQAPDLHLSVSIHSLSKAKDDGHGAIHLEDRDERKLDQ